MVKGGWRVECEGWKIQVEGGMEGGGQRLRVEGEGWNIQAE